MAQPRKDATPRPVAQRIESPISIDHRCNPSCAMVVARRECKLTLTKVNAKIHRQK